MALPTKLSVLETGYRPGVGTQNFPTQHDLETCIYRFIGDLNDLIEVSGIEYFKNLALRWLARLNSSLVWIKMI